MHTTAVARLLYLIHKLKKPEFFFKIIFLHSAVGQRASSKSKKVLYCKPLKGKNCTSFKGFFSTVQKVDPMSFAVHLVFRENCQKMRLRVNWLGTKQSCLKNSSKGCDSSFKTSFYYPQANFSISQEVLAVLCSKNSKKFGSFLQCFSYIIIFSFFVRIYKVFISRLGRKACRLSYVNNK